MTERVLLEDMEKELLVDRYGMDYEGVFDYQGLLKMIDKWCAMNDFYTEIKGHKEKVMPTGRNISYDYEIQRKFTKIHFSVIQFEIEIEGMEDIEMEIDGKMRNLNKGKIKAIFHSYLMTHQKARWETKAYIYFIRGIVDKFIYKLDKPVYRGVVYGDTYNLINEIKGFLNVFAHQTGGQGPTGRLKGGWV